MANSLEVEVVEVEDVAGALKVIMERMDLLTDLLEDIQHTQAEIIEKLDNIGLGDGLGLSEYES